MDRTVPYDRVARSQVFLEKPGFLHVSAHSVLDNPRRNSGTRFDPQVTDAFESMLQNSFSQGSSAATSR